MSVTDARFAALCALYGETSATATTNDLLARWRADNGVSGDSERDLIMGFYPGLSYADAIYSFWLDGGNVFSDDPLLVMLGGSAVLWLDAAAHAAGEDIGRDAIGRWLPGAFTLLLSADEADDITDEYRQLLLSVPSSSEFFITAGGVS
jgi:hypothetical protein